MTIIWCMVPEIWSVTDRLFCRFGLFFAILPPNNPKNQNFEKLKRMPGDIIILHMCTINDNQMMRYWARKNLKNASRYYHFTHVYYKLQSWCMVPEISSVTDRIFCHFGPFFAHLPLKNPNNQNFEKIKKKAWRYSHFTQVYQILWSYAILFLRYGAWRM